MPSPRDTTGTRLLADGDAAYGRFDHRAALALYQRVLEADPDHYEALWRASRTCSDIGQQLPSSASDREVLAWYEKARAYADRAIAADPHRAEAYTFRAIAHAMMGLREDLLSAIGLVKRVKLDGEKALSLDRNSDIAHYVMGRLHYEVCQKPKFMRVPVGLGWGNYEEAARYLRRALSLNPGSIRYHFALARVYAEMGNKQEAMVHLSKVETLPAQAWADAGFKEEARQLAPKMQRP